MSTEELLVLKFIRKLQDPVPQYVLGCLPAIATIGAAPWDDFTDKLLWLTRCLGCPFTGLFYTCCIKHDVTSLCIYWLPSDRFRHNGDEIQYRPFGIYAMDAGQVEFLNECVAKSSVLERMASLASLYYIIVGIVSGIVRATGPTVCDEDWPSIPLALCWTLPAIFRRTIRKNLVVKDPNKVLTIEIVISLSNFKEEHIKSNLLARVAFTALMSIVVPWSSVFLAYFTPPVGFFCRSKYLSTLCSIWSFNSILALLCHLKGEKFVTSNKFIHTIFCTCGIIVAFLLFVLGLLSNQNSWWVGMFGITCDISSACPVVY